VEAGWRLIARAGDARRPGAEGARLGVELSQAERMRIGPVATHDQHRKLGDGGASENRTAAPRGWRRSAPVRWRVEDAKWRAQFTPDEEQVPDRARAEVKAAEGSGGSGLDDSQTGCSGGVVAVAGVDDLEALGGRVEVGEPNQGDGDAGTTPAVLVDVTAVHAAPDVDLTGADRRPVAQLAGREAEFLVANMRVDRAARARYAAGAPTGPFHGKTLCRGMAAVKENSLIEIRRQAARCRSMPLDMVICTRNGRAIPIVGRARYACGVGGAGGSGNFTYRL
jgi:hypothetical protein